ncbi:hypothetical protein EDD11_001728 [Mortierella claussenii]|nr:hypothetical protein EDD11_001728 [Mortierella claussenii]
MQLVTLSNLKLNNDMFSNRSLSIHRRILVKNFLTLLYQLDPPMDWMQQMQQTTMDYNSEVFGTGSIPGLDETTTASDGTEMMLLREDEQNGWMERTLTVAGLDDDDNDTSHGRSNDGRKDGNSSSSSASSAQKPGTNPFRNHLSTPSASAPSSLPSSPSSTPPSSLLPSLSFSGSSVGNSKATSDSTTPLPRPKSTELPQTLHSYLSTVFDVNWSVELPSKEDLLFTHATGSQSSSLSSSSTSSSSPSISSIASKRKSISTASGLSSVSNAFPSTHASSSSSGTSASPRSSTTSTSSSFSTVSTTSSASSVSTVGTVKNGLGAGVGAGAGMIGKSNTPAVTTGSGLDNNHRNGPVSTAPTNLVRKSSLPTNHTRNNNTNSTMTGQGIDHGRALNGVSAISHGQVNMPADSKPMPIRKASVNGHTKPMLLPGRRSSLLQTGQMPPALSPSNSSTNGNIGLGRTNSNTMAATTATTTTTTSNNSIDNNSSLGPSRSVSSAPSLSPSLSPTSLSPISLSPTSPTMPSLSPPLSFVKTATSPTLKPVKPSFSRRTSSLPAERPKPIQRTPSSDHSGLSPASTVPMMTGAALATSPTMTATTLSVPEANIIGLPRPLLNPTPSGLLSSSPPSPSTLTPSPTVAGRGALSSGSSPKHIASPPLYTRSTSDDQVQTRSSAQPSQQQQHHHHYYHHQQQQQQQLSQHQYSAVNSTALNGKTVSPSPSVYSTAAGAATASTTTAVSGMALPPLSHSSMTTTATLSRPSPTYLKASKSSPCLVGLDKDSQDATGPFPAMPDLSMQQQYQLQSYPDVFPGQMASSTPGIGAGVKLLARTSSRRGMASPSSSASTGGSGSAYSASRGTMASGQGAMNISAPLPLIPHSPSYNDFEGYDDHDQQQHQHVKHHGPYGRYQGGGMGHHAYAQSMSNVSVMSSTSGHSQKTIGSGGGGGGHAKPASAGRWNSMKMMLGLRVGQGAKG